MGQAMAALQQTISTMDSPSASTRSPGTSAEASVDALNRIAMQARAAAQQMSQGQQSGTSAEQMMQALERMAQQQADVNNQAGQMMPMQLSQQALQEQMQQLSQGQQSVASDLDDLARKESDEGPLGDLEAMAKEAEALARELAQGRLDPETRRRQEELFHHLLDAGRSLEKEEYSEERESESPGTFEPGEVAPLTRDALGLLRFQAPDAETLGRLPPAARALVLRYFQRLNRGGSGATPPPARPGGS
jgi:hypothetical protein